MYWCQSLSVFVALWVAIAAPSGVYAQHSDATCTLVSYQWSFNSRKQSPCEVASALFGICNNGVYQVQTLLPGSHYLGPSIDNANPCQCSTVSYSLMMACAACQGGTITSWSVWSTNCPSVSIDSFPEPLPQNTFVPGWAYLNVVKTGSFNPATAEANANATVESSALPQPTHSPTPSSIGQNTSSSTTASVPTSSSSGSTDSTSSLVKHSNAVVGGIVGGLFAVVVFLLLCLVYHLKRSKSVRQPSELDSNSVEPQKEPLPALATGTYASTCSLSQNSNQPVSLGAYSNSIMTDSVKSASAVAVVDRAAPV